MIKREGGGAIFDVTIQRFSNFDLSNGLKLVLDTHFVGLKMFVKREVCTDFASAPLPYDGKITQKPYTESKSANDCAVGEGLAPPASRCF